MSLIPKKQLLFMPLPELEEYMTAMGEPAYRGRQVYQWIYKRQTGSFYEMSDLPKSARQKLDEIALISIPRVLKQRAASDGTRKFLLELEDKKRIETVVIPQNDSKTTDYTVCISTQVGCVLGCSFCATGRTGWQRDLLAYEMAGQVLGSERELSRRLRTRDRKHITNVVYMGMGEPLLNYDAVIESIIWINDPKGINIGQRHITVSTAGHVPGIRNLAQEGLQVTLAVSLHAADNDLRSRLMPINRKYSLEKLLAAVEYYLHKTNRRVTFEYIMLEGINIHRHDADNLIRLVKPLLANVNLIPYNEVEGSGYHRPSRQRIMQFHGWLVQGGLNVAVREEHGREIKAACGQLHLRKAK